MDNYLINAIHSHLTHVARSDEDFVHYAEVIQMAGIGHLGEGALEGALGNVFYEVNQYDWSQDPNRPMLSAIAVSSQTGYPSKGFYRLARDKGIFTSKKELDELDFWVKELRELRRYWQSHSNASFKGREITYQTVTEELENFDEKYPNSGDYDLWLEKNGYKFALVFDGRLYPPKHILSTVSGVDVSQFSGGDQTNQVFNQLGLVVINKPNFVVQPAKPDHTAYLLTWNPGKSDWDNFQEDWESVFVGNRPRFGWSCGNTRRIRVGDRIFLMHLGWREKVTGIVASGWVTGEPQEDQHRADGERSALYVEFEPDVLLNPEVDQLLDPILVSTDFNWRPQSSGITIPSEVAARLELVWRNHVQTMGHNEPTESEDAYESPTYTEGARKLVTGYRYERDPNARDACIKAYGTHCAACGFDFGKVFGTIGEGYIHVHHLTPISERATEYTVDPINDLRPVCPNCHAMLHRTSPPISIDQLKAILLNQKLSEEQ